VAQCRDKIQGFQRANYGRIYQQGVSTNYYCIHSLHILVKNEKDTLILNQASEIERLRAELAKRDEEINRIRQEYKLKEMKLLRTVEDGIISLRDELEEVRGKDKSRVLALADVGETIFLDGAGEALMAVSGDRTILRFLKSNSDRADRYLGSVGEKHTTKEYVYYIAPTAALK
jgi:hypothetical protein